MSKMAELSALRDQGIVKDCENKDTNCPYMGSMGTCQKGFAGDPRCPEEGDENETT